MSLLGFLVPAFPTLPVVNKAPAVVQPIVTTVLKNIISTTQNLLQQYEVQTYNADGTIVTKYEFLGQLVLNTSQSFTPENAANLTATQTSEAKLLQSLNLTPSQQTQVIQDAIKVDYFLCIKSQESLPLEFNNLQTPSLSLDLNYNFYTADEANQATQEDQTADPLLFGQDPPRYVQLNWDVTATAQESPDFAPRTQAEAQMVNTYLSLPRGTTTISNAQTPNSFQSNLAQVNPIFRDGMALQLVDTHDLPRAFNSTSNSRIFKNAALTTINTNNVDVNTINLNDLLLEDL